MCSLFQGGFSAQGTLLVLLNKKKSTFFGQIHSNVMNKLNTMFYSSTMLPLTGTDCTWKTDRLK